MDEKKFKRLQKSMKQALQHARGNDSKITMTEIRVGWNHREAASLTFRYFRGAQVKNWIKPEPKLIIIL
jgi:hypothetical protein